jgi:hypothetical protein
MRWPKGRGTGASEVSVAVGYNNKRRNTLRPESGLER